MLLEVNNLTKTYMTKEGSPVCAVDHISFSMDEGEMLGLIGESGSGKSTVAEMICRFIEPTEGRILFDGKDITNTTGRALRPLYEQIQMVFQSPAESFDPKKTLGCGIAEGMRNSGVSKAAAEERMRTLLTHCGLHEDYAGRFPHEVSGGECQRAAVARAIARNPRLLICDEATSALDVTIQKDIIELLLSLKKEMGLSILFISHDIALVCECCERLIVMQKGKLVETGLSESVIKSPKHPYTRRLIEGVLTI